MRAGETILIKNVAAGASMLSMLLGITSCPWTYGQHSAELKEFKTTTKQQKQKRTWSWYVVGAWEQLEVGSGSGYDQDTLYTYIKFSNDKNNAYRLCVVANHVCQPDYI